MKKSAIALKYSKDFDAPFIAAKGEGVKAEKIIEIAKKENIPIEKNFNVINLLENSDEGTFVPESAYKVLAVLFAYILENSGEKSE